ncbi:MAG: M56 family metallopeptidase [Candidatus Rokuibacteriota bacterium]
MRFVTPRSGSGYIGALALTGLGVMAALLLGAAVLALGTETGRTAGVRLVEACLLVSERVATRLALDVQPSPLTVLALAFVGGSLGWALVRLAGSLRGGRRVSRRVTAYERGSVPGVDRALRLTPEIPPTRVRVIHALRPEAFTIGLLGPTLCLSSGLVDQMTETELQAVLRHEWAHAEARDPLRLAAVRLLSDFLWFLPVAPALARLFAVDAELRADATAVAAGTDPVELASVIVKTARVGALSPRLAPALVGLALVERRVTRLLGDPTPAR